MELDILLSQADEEEVTTVFVKRCLRGEMRLNYRRTLLRLVA